MKKKLITLMTIVMLVAAGCAEEKKTKAPSTPDGNDPPVVDVPDDGSPYIPDGNGPGEGPGDNYEFGGTGTLAPVSQFVFSEYAGRPVNNPTDIKININLVKAEGGGTWGGHITISYLENDVFHQGFFTSGHSDKETQWNTWIEDGKFHAIFEDFLGGIVVVIDNYEDLGDGANNVLAGGSVWFKNFGITYAPHPPTRCWFVSIGPYDCRPWPKGNYMDNDPPLYPQAGYQKLGNFGGVNLGDAFNGQLE